MTQYTGLKGAILTILQIWKKRNLKTLEILISSKFFCKSVKMVFF